MSNYCIEKEYTFTPECDKDVEFTLKALTASQRDECISQRFIGGEAEMVINKTKLFRYGVKEISGLSINGKEIKKAGEFLETPVTEIYQEVIGKIFENTARKDPKN